MKIDLEKENCPVCKAKLFTDEVAYCPECGTPHHKKCYLSLGHCYYEDKHSDIKSIEAERISYPKDNTDNKESTSDNYVKEEQPCPDNSRNTSEGNTNLFFKSNGFDPEEEIDGVKVKLIAPYVGYNALRYIRKFKNFVKTGAKASWNWVAFFFTEYWLISRKMYIPAIIKSFITVLLTVCVNIIGTDNLYSIAETGEISFNGMFGWLLVLEIISIIYQLFFAIFGDYYYKNKVISDIKELKKDSSLGEIDYMKAGGVNIIFPIILYIAIEVFVLLVLNFL